MTDLAADAGLAADLVREAAHLARDLRGTGIEVSAKTSVSDVVTAADHAAERLIVDHLAAWRPDDGVYGEEGAARTGSSGRTWVIDPIDGTYNFVRGLPWWCSALALTEGSELLLGAIYDAHDDTLYVGGPELPSTRNGVRIGPMPDVSLAETCVATYLHPPYLETPVGVAFRRAVGGAATLRMLGSGSLDAVAVASGAMGVLVQHSVPDWDRLPGAAIIRGAGGVARTVAASGVTWAVSGAPTAVAELCAALEQPGH